MTKIIGIVSGEVQKVKKIKLLPLIILVFLGFSYSANADPIISNITMEPSNPWFGEDVFISCVCYDDNENYTISNVYADILGPNITISNWNLDKENDTYSDTIYHSYLYRTGEYDVTFYCENNVSINTTETRSFTVSNLTSYIDDITSSLAYIGDEIKIDVTVKKDDTILDSGVNFTVSLNGQRKNLKQDPPIFDSNKGWILKIDAPSTTGTYDLDVLAEYGEAETTSSSSIKIKQPLEFELVSIDKTWIIPDDIITLNFNASFKGNNINLTKEYLNIKIGSNVCSIQDISQAGNYSDVKILAPNLSPGRYDLKITFSYMDFVKDISKEIEYVVSISGSILNSDDKAVNTELRFKNNEVDETFVTESNGSYSGRLPIGVYDLELIFPNSKLFLDEVTINEFNNPIKFDNTTTETNLKDIDVIEIFVYEIKLNYSDAYLEMEYDDSKTFNEKNIVVYKCENWNFGKKTCSKDWNLISPEIDKAKNLVKVNTTSLSAFLIGYKKELHLEFSLDKEEYYLKDIIKITGTIEDNDRIPIPDVDIKVSVSDTSITASTKSDNNGLFSLELQGPENEGTYTVSITAEKSSLTPVTKSTTIKFVRKESLSLIVPSDIELKGDENASTEIIIVNTGKTDLLNLTLSLTGIPEEYYNLSTTQIDQITVGEEKKIPITFMIPLDANKKSYTGKFKVTYDDTYKEEEFTLTILSEEIKGEVINETLSNTTSRGFQFPSISLPTAYLVLPFEGFDIFSISLFAIFTFSASFWLKKRKSNAKLERSHVKNLLLDIKREINRKPRRIEWVKKEITKND